MASFRFISYIRFPTNRHIFATTLANDGFRYDSVFDHVRCDFCKVIFRDWTKGHKGAHDAHSSRCVRKSNHPSVGTCSTPAAIPFEKIQSVRFPVLHSIEPEDAVIGGKLQQLLFPYLNENLGISTETDGQDLKRKEASLQDVQEKTNTKTQLFRDDDDNRTHFQISGGKRRVLPAWLFQLGAQNLPPVHVYTLGAAPEVEEEEQLGQGQGQDREQGQGQQPGPGSDQGDQEQGQDQEQEQGQEQGQETEGQQQQPEDGTDITTANEPLSMRSERLRYASFHGVPQGRIQDWPRRLSAKGYVYDVEHDSITCFYCHCGPGGHHGHCEWERCNIPFESTSFPPAEPRDALISMGATLRQRRGTARSFDTTETEQMTPLDGQSATSDFAEETGDASATTGFYPVGSTLERRPPTRASTGTRQLHLSVLQKQTDPSQHSYSPPGSLTTGFKCANCKENPATLQVPSCGHVVCPSCLDPGQRVICPLCRADTRHT
ncbi:uncharacterized protein [Littorina saxatilis]|uniref:RING-type domain-containing protein n=1 Tax=Littorina saxatilis TaxID=31220 RepID=A0AAN9GHL7_9CAEN